MNFFNIGPGELLFILVIALIIFGPGRLPEIAKGLGKAVGDFRRASQGLTDDLTRELNTLSTDKERLSETLPIPAASSTETHAAVEAPAAQTSDSAQQMVTPQVGSGDAGVSTGT